MTFLIFAWIASITYGLEVVVGKYVVKHKIANPWLFNFVWSFLVVCFVLPFALVNHVGIPQFTGNLLWFSLFYTLANILYILSIQLMDISALSPLFNIRSVFSLLLGVILLGETLTFWQGILIAIIILAGVAVNIDEKLKVKAFFRPALFIVFLFLLVLSVVGLFTNLAIADVGFWNTTLWSMIISQGFLLFTIPLFWKDLLKTNIKKYSGLLVMASVSAIAMMAANQAFASNVGISSVILSLPFSLIMTIIISLMKPKLLEEHSGRIYLLRVFGAAVMLIAALQLSQ